MTSYNTIYGGNRLKAADIKGKNVPPLTIERVSIAEFDQNGKRETKLELHFAGTDKTLILNQTNCAAIEYNTGTDQYENWIGSKVSLYVEPTQFGGKIVDAIRVKLNAQSAVPGTPPPQPQPGFTPAPRQHPAFDDDIPF